MDAGEIAKLRRNAKEAEERFQRHLTLMELSTEAQREKLVLRYAELLRRRDDAYAALRAAEVK